MYEYSGSSRMYAVYEQTSSTSDVQVETYVLLLLWVRIYLVPGTYIPRDGYRRNVGSRGY